MTSDRDRDASEGRDGLTGSAPSGVAARAEGIAHIPEEDPKPCPSEVELARTIACRHLDADMNDVFDGSYDSSPVFAAALDGLRSRATLTQPAGDVVERARREAIILIDEINERAPSRQFYGIGQTLHAKLCTIRATLARAATLSSTPVASGEVGLEPTQEVLGRIAYAIIEGSAGVRAADHAREFVTANWTDAVRSARNVLTEIAALSTPTPDPVGKIVAWLRKHPAGSGYDNNLLADAIERLARYPLRSRPPEPACSAHGSQVCASLLRG